MTCVAITFEKELTNSLLMELDDRLRDIVSKYDPGDCNVSFQNLRDMPDTKKRAIFFTKEQLDCLYELLMIENKSWQLVNVRSEIVMQKRSRAIEVTGFLLQVVSSEMKSIDFLEENK